MKIAEYNLREAILAALVEAENSGALTMAEIAAIVRTVLREYESREHG